MALSLALPRMSKRRLDAARNELPFATKVRIRQRRLTGDLYVVRVDDEVITWNKQHRLGQGGFATCYLGMRSRDGTAPLPCVVRSRKYLPDLDVDTFALAQRTWALDGSEVPEAAAAREDVIAARVSPAVYEPMKGLTVARKAGQPGCRVFTVGALMTGDLQQLFDASCREGISAEQLVRVFLGELAPKLATMHVAFMHNDIKASNVLFSCSDGRVNYEIADFGFAHALPTVDAEDELLRLADGANNTGQRNAVSGAEESLMGIVDDPASDIFSLGLMCLQMLTGCPPFDFLTSQVGTTTVQERHRLFDVFDECRPKDGELQQFNATPLHVRYCAMWNEVAQTCEAFFVNLLSEMVARVYEVELTHSGVRVKPLGNRRRPSAREILGQLEQNPLPQDVISQVTAVAESLADGGGKKSARNAMLEAAAAQHVRINPRADARRSSP